MAGNRGGIIYSGGHSPLFFSYSFLFSVKRQQDEGGDLNRHVIRTYVRSPGKKPNVHVELAPLAQEVLEVTHSEKIRHERY